jgi:hypothetical protein
MLRAVGGPMRWLATFGGDHSVSRYARTMKLLVITSEPITADHLRNAVGSDAADDAEVLVIAPALHTSALRFWSSDADDAIARAQTVQRDSVDQLGSEGITALGDTGESEPLAAIADTLQGFPGRPRRSVHPPRVRAVLPRKHHRGRNRSALRPAGNLIEIGR